MPVACSFAMGRTPVLLPAIHADDHKQSPDTARKVLLAASGKRCCPS